MTKKIDFGVAGQLMDASSKRNTIIGTPFWMVKNLLRNTLYALHVGLTQSPNKNRPLKSFKKTGTASMRIFGLLESQSLKWLKGDRHTTTSIQ